MGTVPAMTLGLILRLFVPFALANILGAFYRTVTSVLAPDIIAELHLSAEAVGLLTSVFFLVFAGAQLPLGILLDRYGARTVTGCCAFVAAVGAVLFARTDDLGLLALGRALMGFGMAVGLMGGFKALVDWLPREKVPFGNGIILMMGGLGTMGATAPTQWALSITDWHGVFEALAAITVVVGALLLIVAPDKPRTGARLTMGEALRALGHVFSDPQFLRSAPLGGLIMGVSMSVNSLWSGPWMQDVAGVPRPEIANVLFGIAFMMTISVFFTGSIVERLERAGVTMLTTSAIGIVGFIFFQVLIVLNPPVSPYLLWLPLAFFGTSPVLIYTVLTRAFPPQLAGRVNTAYNFITFAAAFGAQWSIGAIIDLWPPLGEGHFDPVGYRTGLGVMIALEVCAFIWMVVAPRPARASLQPGQ